MWVCPTCALIEALNTAVLESDYTHAVSPKPLPELPVRVFVKSQLMAALRQHSRPIIIEDPDLALPFIRMLRARGSDGGRRPSRSNDLCHGQVLRRRRRSALVYRSIYASRKRAASYPKAEGSAAS